MLDALLDAGAGDGAPGWESLKALYAAPAPVVYASARFAEQATVANYAATQRSGTQEVHGLAGRDAMLVQRGPKVCVADPEVLFVWPSVDVPVREVDALAWRAARVGYLGCAGLQSTAGSLPSTARGRRRCCEPLGAAPGGGADRGMRAGQRRLAGASRRGAAGRIA